LGGGKTTINTCLSHRYEATSRVCRREEGKFDSGCGDFKIVDQELRMGDGTCERCRKKIERRERMEKEGRDRVGSRERVEGNEEDGKKAESIRVGMGDIEKELEAIEREMEMRRIGGGKDGNNGEKELVGQKGDNSSTDVERPSGCIGTKDRVSI
jgi:hypothetical protein